MTTTVCEHNNVIRTCDRCDRAAGQRPAVCDHGQLARSCEVCERDAEIARLQRIETAARAVLASGQARYRCRSFGGVLTTEFESQVEPGDGDDAEYAGDLVPAAQMTALAEAVHGATASADIPPAALEYAAEVGRALEESDQ